MLAEISLKQQNFGDSLVLLNDENEEDAMEQFEFDVDEEANVAVEPFFRNSFSNSFISSFKLLKLDVDMMLF
jgi:hypothetical protein